MSKLLLLGDVNLMGVTDPNVPFRQVADRIRAADLAFCNLECVLSHRPGGGTWEMEGYFADPEIGGACLAASGIGAVGMANNMTVGGEEILSSLAVLDRYGIAHTGAGANAEAAYEPVLLERGGLRFGVTQRSCVYWAHNHEGVRNVPGIAVLRGHTAYQVPMFRIAGKIPPVNRPGIPPLILTWADPGQLRRCTGEIAALRKESDVVIASFHWGLDRDVLDYMREIAHAAIDAGADVVFGHGPHYALGIEVYKGKPIFYGLGNFSFDTERVPVAHKHWMGMLASLEFEGDALREVSLVMVRRNQANETVILPLSDEEAHAELDEVATRSAAMGATLRRDGDRAVLALS